MSKTNAKYPREERKNAAREALAFVRKYPGLFASDRYIPMEQILSGVIDGSIPTGRPEIAGVFRDVARGIESSEAHVHIHSWRHYNMLTVMEGSSGPGRLHDMYLAATQNFGGRVKENENKDTVPTDLADKTALEQFASGFPGYRDALSSELRPVINRIFRSGLGLEPSVSETLKVKVGKLEAEVKALKKQQTSAGPGLRQ
ncbi:MAG TPA: hypothetical protein VL625_00110 [Patescibacteria group bacterium]|jgi:hypothetical protein|nr:hypothetical protein [Patescibacteria group bacterium]